MGDLSQGERGEKAAATFLDPERTLLGTLFPEQLPVSLLGRAARLFVEATFVTAISIYLPVMLGLEHAGLISVFLVAAVLSDRLTLVLEENRRDIRVLHRGGWQSNTTTALSILLVFSGMSMSYWVVACIISDDAAKSAFSFTSQLAGLESANLLTRNFGSLTPILFHNFGVVIVIAFLAFLYRSYGVMLALAWNACVWGFVFAVLTVQGYRGGVLTDPASLVIAYAAVTPHLVLETTAYVLTSLAFLFVSKALGTYTIGDPRFRDTMVAGGVLVGLGLFALLVAACAESYLATSVFSVLD